MLYVGENCEGGGGDKLKARKGDEPAKGGSRRRREDGVLANSGWKHRLPVGEASRESPAGMGQELRLTQRARARGLGSES
jgi:hypothetical protein